MHANDYLRAGKLKEAVQSLVQQVRENPLDAKARTFLFELLCFSGEYERAGKQLEVLAQGGQNAELGTLLYQAALNAEKSRQQFFANREYEFRSHVEPVMAGTLNGAAFGQISDADPRIGPRLEVFLGGAYLWVAFEHITSITVQAPKRLRDLIWTPAIVRTADSFRGADLGEVLLPVLSPFTWQHTDDEVRLGRQTVWEPQENGLVVPFGQKILLVDGNDVPILELRDVELKLAAAA